MTTSEWLFNFGPIARTEASENKDTFNLVSLPLHVMLDAVMASTNRDEFVAWLWHDLFKPAFYWQPRGNGFSWNHVPGFKGSPFEPAEALYAGPQITNVPIGLVSTHHSRRPLHGRAYFSVQESDILSDQVDQVNLGAASVYVQLAFAVQPALPTAVVRAVVAESFMEVVTKDVAEALQNMLATKAPAFSRVRFVFETDSSLRFSTPATNSEIWNNVGQQFDVQIVDDEIVIRHMTPVNTVQNFSTEFTVELSGEVPPPDQMPTTLGLAELLTVYQDDRTIIMTVPHPQIYGLKVGHLRDQTLQLAREKLKALDVLVTDKDVDLLTAVFESQIEIREVPGRLSIPPNPHLGGKRSHPRPIDEIIAYPGILLSRAADKKRRCRICGSPFISELPQARKWPGRDFTDSEFLAAAGDICPICRIYTLNTHKSRTPEEKRQGITGDRKALRGSFALLLPSSHFDVKDEDCRLIERPPLDEGGRFDLAQRPLERVTVTQQEFALFNQMSRRVIAALWRKIDPESPMPLPYTGGILLTQREAEKVRRVLPTLRGLLAPVTLLAYPFEISVRPAVEIALDVVLTDFKQHHTKYTHLKSLVSILPVDPHSRLFVLADSKLQIDINRDWFNACDRLAAITAGLSTSQRKEWMRRVSSGSDIMTAYFESLQTTLLKRRDATEADRVALLMVDNVWGDLFGAGADKGWLAYQQTTDEIQAILERYPMLSELISAMIPKKENDDGN